MPIIKGNFLRFFALAAKKFFGEKNGFKQVFHEERKDYLKFDMLDCTYCNYCRALDCPEVIHIFCQSDVYNCGQLDNFSFERKGTLEYGDKCDFTLTRR